MRNILSQLIPIGVIVVFAATVFLSEPLFALSLQEGVNAARGSGQPTDLFGPAGIVSTITNVLLFIAGALSVIMIIIGGLRYAISGGNSGNVTAAKNTVLYAIIGLIVAFLAYAIVNWVLGALVPGSSGSGFSDV